ncbi:putative methyltransferase small domain-containing protein [Rosellinia necatrix]|uniref:Putative methyltransferase small domain-containing protein n=1 Tax=Rosellinia necatrix TaxID=77044 RepID=A0A1S7UIT4_ROSNE|nr:putative methyltransferase small domain-containing protein [Rosellinia necatrix]
MAAPTTAADPPFSSIRYLPTNEAYDRWAEVYDSDGNFLQALDDLELKTLFPRFAASVVASSSSSSSSEPQRVVDLGCGTGRNTALLLAGFPEAEVVALDASQGMLEVARARLAGPAAAAGGRLHLGLFDMLAGAAPPASVAAGTADGVVSTLVAEHVPLPAFFAHAAQLLRPGGALLLTNMHPDMGAVSQAGFVDRATGEKIRPTSYAHAVGDVVREARAHGLEVLPAADGEAGILERVVGEDMVEALGPRSAKWVGVACWFGGVFRKVEA